MGNTHYRAGDALGPFPTGHTIVGLNYLSSFPVYYELLKSPLPFKVPLKVGGRNGTYFDQEKNLVVKIFDSSDVVHGNVMEMMQIARIKIHQF